MDLVTRQQEERKQRILSVARQLIAEHGYDGVTMRYLADKSLVSVPTLYNLFGGKNELLLAATQTYFVDLVGDAKRIRSEEGLTKIVALADTLGRESMRHTAYVRSLMRFFASLPDTGGLHEIAANQMTAELERALVQMQQKQQLVAWADTRALAARLASQLSITIFEWAREQLGDESLRDVLLYGTGVTLLGLARGEAAEELEKLVREHQNAAAEVPGPGRAAAN